MGFRPAPGTSGSSSLSDTTTGLLLPQAAVAAAALLQSHDDAWVGSWPIPKALGSGAERPKAGRMLFQQHFPDTAGAVGRAASGALAPAVSDGGVRGEDDTPLVLLGTSSAEHAVCITCKQRPPQQQRQRQEDEGGSGHGAGEARANFLQDLSLSDCVGAGGNAVVYRGRWRGAPAAVKVRLPGWRRSCPVGNGWYDWPKHLPVFWACPFSSPTRLLTTPPATIPLFQVMYAHSEQQAASHATEMAVVSSVCHPNVVQAYTCFTDQIDTAVRGASPGASSLRARSPWAPMHRGLHRGLHTSVQTGLHIDPHRLAHTLAASIQANPRVGAPCARLPSVPLTPLSPAGTDETASSVMSISSTIAPLTGRRFRAPLPDEDLASAPGACNLLVMEVRGDHLCSNGSHQADQGAADGC